MGRRRSSRKPPPKRKIIEALPKQFNCPFCNHERSCEVEMQVTFLNLKLDRNRDRGTGYVQCRICLEDYQCPVNYLSQEIDVYNDWIDECEVANS
ncbi:unnamed protein product [Schistocephalus solidus]|uniref:Transcription elongation factor 1 homolog n=1 Tax=Schistocephalus solidus TaxID=70667 RepID=A0A183TSI8_SCHSO|nr:unnamed protein product [Schistocephalus solidus]